MGWNALEDGIVEANSLPTFLMQDQKKDRTRFTGVQFRAGSAFYTLMAEFT
jgi:hypothetical protein